MIENWSGRSSANLDWFSWYLVGPVVAAVAIVSVLSVLQAFAYAAGTVSFDDQEIQIDRPLRGVRTIRYQDIIEIRIFDFRRIGHNLASLPIGWKSVMILEKRGDQTLPNLHFVTALPQAELGSFLELSGLHTFKTKQF